MPEQKGKAMHEYNVTFKLNDEQQKKLEELTSLIQKREDKDGSLIFPNYTTAKAFDFMMHQGSEQLINEKLDAQLNFWQYFFGNIL